MYYYQTGALPNNNIFDRNVAGGTIGENKNDDVPGGTFEFVFELEFKMCDTLAGTFSIWVELKFKHVKLFDDATEVTTRSSKIKTGLIGMSMDINIACILSRD